MLEGGEEIVIQFLLLLAGLVDQRLALGDRIVLLGVGRGDFLPVDAAFEHLDGGRIFRRELGQRDQLLWQMSDECWLNQRRLDQFLEQAVGDLEILVVRGDLRAEIDRALAAFVGRDVEPVVTAFLPNQILVLHAAPRPGEVDGAGDIPLGILVLDHECADHLLGHAYDHRLEQFHHRLVIAKRLIGLEHGELRVVPGRDALVAVVAADLEHAIHPADEQPLEI